MTLVYSNERRLFRICAVISVVMWATLIAGTLGIALMYVAMGAFAALVAQSAFISYLRGTGVRVSRQQLPELYDQVLRCCRVLGIDECPDVYVLNAHGLLNALAARFLRRHYVVLYSDVIDALREHPGALGFYIGHELGHIARGHLVWGPLLWPARLLPLLGAAYARAGEYTCDLHGLACCEDPNDALRGVAVLAGGRHAAGQLDLAHYAAQSETSGGFWMSLHELLSDYPWLTKRAHRLLSASRGETSALPRRHAFAWFLALFVPHLGGGGSAALAPMMVVVAMVGMLAAIAIPNFVKYQQRARAMQMSAVPGVELDESLEPEGSLEESAEAEPAAAEPDEQPQHDDSASAQLLGRWHPLSEESATFREISFGAGHSVIVTLEDGGRALGTFELANGAVTMEVSAPSGPLEAGYQLTTSGGRVLLRPLQGGPFYGRE